MNYPQQNSQDFLCQQLDHEQQKIIGFCLNYCCFKTSQFCFLCAQQLHQSHQNDCLTFLGIINLLSNSIKLMQQYEIKSKQLFEYWEFCEKKFKSRNSSRLFQFKLFAKKFVQRVLFLQSFAHKGQQYLEMLILNLKIENYQFIRTQIKSLKLINNLKIDFDKTLELNKHIDKLNNFCDFLEKNNLSYSESQSLNSEDNKAEQVLIDKFKNSINQNENSQQQNLKNFIDQGNNLLKLQNYELAIFRFENALKFNPNCIEALEKKGDALFKLKQFEEALVCYDKILQIDSSYGSCVVSRGYTLVELERVDEAISYFDYTIDQDPTNFKLYFSKGIALEKQNKLQEALACYEIANSINYPEPKQLYFQCNLLSRLNYYEQCIECLDKLLQINQNHAPGLNLKGVCLTNLKNYEKALDCCEQACKIDGKNLLYLQNYGLCLKQQSLFIKAKSVFEQCIELDKKNHLTWIYKGSNVIKRFSAQVLAALQDFKQALECCDEALSLSQTPPAWYYWQKGQYLNEIGQYEEYLRCFTKASEIDPFNAEFHSYKGQTLFRIKLYHQAIISFDKAQYLNPKSEDNLIWKGDALVKMNEIDEAFDCYNLVFQINPKNVEAFEKRQYCNQLLNERLEQNQKIKPKKEETWKFKWPSFPGRRKFLF